MRRNGFTMVELIFVIIIIGILSVAAIPKFGDIKDRAKINAEYSSLSGLDSALVAKMEFYKDDNPAATTFPIDWHNLGATGYAGANLGIAYKVANDANKVFKGVIKKGDDFKIVAYHDYVGLTYATGAGGVDDIIFIKGAASNTNTGVTADTSDTSGKPDNNDVWVFNGTPVSIAIDYDNGSTKVVQSGEISLIDIATTTALTYGSTGVAGEVFITQIGSDATDVDPIVTGL